MTFIIRAWIDGEGRLRGVVLHTQTGRKERFDDASHLCALLAGLVRPHGPSPASLARLDENLP